MKLDCIILAAGAATRFGSCKLSADYHGQPLIARAVNAAHVLAPERIIMVSGAWHQQLQTLTITPAVELHYCADWQLGMGHSLAFGVSQLTNNNPVLILLGDQAQIGAQELQNLWRIWNNNPTHIACASFADTLGVPAIFPANFKPLLRECRGDRGAKQLLFNYAQHVVAVDMPAAAFDVDVVADLQRELLSG